MYWWLLVAALVAQLARAQYSEQLALTPLPRNKLLAAFAFSSASPPFALHHHGGPPPPCDTRHYGAFPRSIEPALAASNTRRLSLRFTQGWWDPAWGSLPAAGALSGGTGVELAAVVEAPDLASAQRNWLQLAQSLSGFFCASLNFVDAAITTFPRHELADAAHLAAPNNSLFLMRAALPDEPICTENLTPFLKMLPTRGKAGVASLLDGHKLYDSLWHAMSIDVDTVCDAAACRLHLAQHIHHVVDVMRSLRRTHEGGIPRPTPGDSLRCDSAKKHDSWTCFPLADPTDLSWDIESLFGRPIRGAGFDDPSARSTVLFNVDPAAWAVQAECTAGDAVSSRAAGSSFALEGTSSYNFVFNTTNSSQVAPLSPPPIYASRSLTGYSQDKGGMRINVKNPSAEPVTIVYFETLPWFMRVYLHTLTVTGSGAIVDQFYKPAIDRTRPGHLEWEISIPAGADITLTYQFDKSLLLYAEYPPDANHGFGIAPAVIKVLGPGGKPTYQLRTTGLLLTLPTPDFSMPYNVIILTCTVMSLAFGTIFNLLTKKVVTEAEFEAASQNSKLAKLKAKIRAFKGKKN